LQGCKRILVLVIFFDLEGISRRPGRAFYHGEEEAKRVKRKCSAVKVSSRGCDAC
jgi:hypothetical protein